MTVSQLYLYTHIYIYSDPLIKSAPLLIISEVSDWNKNNIPPRIEPGSGLLPLYRLAGAWQVWPQPFEQHFLGEGQCWSEEQLSTQAAAKPVARWGGGQSPWRDDLREVRNSLLVTHSVCFWGSQREEIICNVWRQMWGHKNTQQVNFGRTRLAVKAAAEMWDERVCMSAGMAAHQPNVNRSCS